MPSLSSLLSLLCSGNETELNTAASCYCRHLKAGLLTIDICAGKESACNAGDLGLIPGMGKSPGEGNGNPLQCSSLENPMDR